MSMIGPKAQMRISMFSLAAVLLIANPAPAPAGSSETAFKAALRGRSCRQGSRPLAQSMDRDRGGFGRCQKAADKGGLRPGDIVGERKPKPWPRRRFSRRRTKKKPGNNSKYGEAVREWRRDPA